MAARPPSTPAPTRRIFLYVDDENEAAMSMAREIVAPRNLMLVMAPDLERAITLARRKPPEVMLINLDRAALDAASLMRVLRGNPATQAAPVLALGKDAAPEAAVKALEAGFFQYLVHPLDARRLTEALDYALEFSALERTEL
jgi:CheY-like chemotaxis protein